MKYNLSTMTFLLTLIMLASKALGFIREMVYANYFGTQYEMDAFLIARLIPNTINSFMSGALIAAFIPIYNEILIKCDKETALDVATDLIKLIFFFGAVLCVVNYFIGEWIIHLLAPGFSDSVAYLSFELSNMLTISILITGVYSVFKGVQEAESCFLNPAFSGIIQNIVIILFIFFTAKNLGIFSLAISAVLGLIAQMVIQFKGMNDLGWRFSWSFHELSVVKKIVYMALPMLLGASSSYINLLVDKMLASTLPEGSISALNYASTLNLAIGSLIVTPFVTVAYPQLAKYAALNDYDNLWSYSRKGINSIIVLSVPISIICLLHSDEIITLLFKRGAFDINAVSMTAGAFACFCLGMIGYSLIELLNRCFYAIKKQKVPVIVSSISVFINIGLNFLFINNMRHVGLALANSVALLVNASCLLFMMQRYGLNLFTTSQCYSFIKICISAFMMIITKNITSYFAYDVYLTSIISVILELFTFYGCCYYMGEKTIINGVNRIINR